MLHGNVCRALLLTSMLAALGCRSPPKKKAIRPNVAPAPLPVVPAPPLSPPAPVEVTFPADGRTLHGFVTKPNGAGPFPAIVYNHGSEKDPKSFRPIRDWFVHQGYVFFLPLRRGHGASPGPYIGDQMKRAADRHAAAPRLLEQQVEDVAGAMRYLSAQPYVTKTRIVVGGCSFGGIETIFAAERGLGFRAALDWAGDAESWNNQGLRQRLLRAVDGAKVPIFFLQAENDHTAEPTRVFGAEAKRAGKPSRAKVFPAFGDPSSHEDGHAGFCVKGSPSWGNDVLQFLQQYVK